MHDDAAREGMRRGARQWSTLYQHVAICGHAKHGKSTLGGRLAFELKAVSLEQIQAHASEAQQRGKDFNRFSMMFLRHRAATFAKGSGLPDDSSRTEFPTRTSMDIGDTRLTLIDTPGGSRFFDNIIYGIFLSDMAIVVVEARKGVEQGTEAVCRALKAFEIPILAFCVTKMDIDAYAEKRFEEVAEEIRELLIPQYCQERDTPIIPVSALEGPGISRAEAGEPSLIEWYEGPVLLEILDNLKGTREQAVTNRLRLAIEGRREVLSPPSQGTILIGTLESGILKVGDTLVAEPASTIHNTVFRSRVKSLRLAKGVTERTTTSEKRVQSRAIVSIGVADWALKDAKNYLLRGGCLEPPQIGRGLWRQLQLMFFSSNLTRYTAGKSTN